MLTVLQNAVETSRPLIEARRQELTLRLPPAESLTVRADSTRLVQVIANLLNNAAKYTPEGGRIVLGAWRDAGHAVVTVEDSGLGIPAAMLPRVFDMFAQVDRSLERSQGGLGIGLALVKKLVEMHGGSVQAESEGENRGSRFTIRVPTIAGSAGSAHARPRPTDALPHLGTRVLIVDDNVDSAEQPGDDVRAARLPHGDGPRRRWRRCAKPRPSLRTWRCSTSACPASAATRRRDGSASYRRAGRCCWWR